MPEAPLIIRGGQSIYPAKVEAILLGHPAVSDVVVVGVPDRFWGQLVAAAVRLSRPTAEAATELTEYCRGRLEPHEVPGRWLFATRLPRTAAGDPCRTTLAAYLAVACGPDRSSWTAQMPAGAAGPPVLDPLGQFGLFGLFDLGRPRDLGIPPQRRSCGLEDLDCQ